MASSRSPRATRIFPSLPAASACLRVGVERRAQRLLVAGRGQLLGLGGNEAVEELIDLRRRDGAGELGGDLAVAKGLHGRDPRTPNVAASVWLRVDVDLGELDGALALGDRALERGRERPARAAPLRPEVDDDGKLASSARRHEPRSRAPPRHRRRSPWREISGAARSRRRGGGVRLPCMDGIASRQAADRVTRARGPELRPQRRAHHRALRRRRDGDRPQQPLGDRRSTRSAEELAEAAGHGPMFVGGPVQPEALVVLAEFTDPERRGVDRRRRRRARVVQRRHHRAGRCRAPRARLRRLLGLGRRAARGRAREESWIVEPPLPAELFPDDPDRSGATSSTARAASTPWSRGCRTILR